MWTEVWFIGGLLAICNIITVRASDFGEISALCTQGCVQVRLVGMQKTGKEWGRREVRGVGIGSRGIKKAAGSFYSLLVVRLAYWQVTASLDTGLRNTNPSAPEA